METIQIKENGMLLFLRWIPRILCILYAVFISLFSFDVFGKDKGFWQSLFDFIIHNIPVIILIAILIISWKWSWIGGISFIALGFVYLLWLSGNDKYLVIYLPLFLIGTLFLLDWFFGKNIKKAQEARRLKNQ